jgi:hypothetical protein
MNSKQRKASKEKREFLEHVNEEPEDPYLAGILQQLEEEKERDDDKLD